MRISFLPSRVPAGLRPPLWAVAGFILLGTAACSGGGGSSSQAVPPPAPGLAGFMPPSGGPGTLVTLSGSHLGPVTAVTFNGTAASSFSVVDDATLTATVPAGATAGPIQVTSPGGVAQSGSFVAGFLSLYAGFPSGLGNLDSPGGPPTQARFNAPVAAAFDAAGDLWVADQGNNVVRCIHAATGLVTTFGTPSVSGNADSGAAGGPLFNRPSGIAVDTTQGPNAGHVYVADAWNHTIRQIANQAGAFTVTTLAGTGKVGINDGGAPGAQTPAAFNMPQGVAVDASGNVWVADTGNYTIREITSVGSAGLAVTTVAGTALQNGSNDSPNALFLNPQALAVDPGNGDLYVADTGNLTIRRISGGVVSTVAGTAGQAGSSDGTGGAASFLSPTGLAVDAHHYVFVADANSQDLRVIIGGTVTTFAGAAGQPGSTDAVGTAARFSAPAGVALAPGGAALAVADTGNNTLRSIPLVPGAPAGGLTVSSTTTYAGLAGQPGLVDSATRSSARFNWPAGLAVDAGGTIWVADLGNYTVRMITPQGGVVTPAYPQYTFYGPAGVAADTTTGSGNVYVADAGSGSIVVLHGGAEVSYVEVTNIGIDAPFGVAVDPEGNVYVADTYGNAVYKIAIASPTTYPVPGTGSLLPGTYNTPYAVAVDAAGSVYVADTNNNRIVVVAGGVASVLAGSGNPGFEDGVGTAASFNQPTGLALDAAGNLYVADSDNQAVRRITTSGPSAGTVVTLAGVGTEGSIAPGPLPALLAFPFGIAVDPGLTTDASGHANPGGSLLITVDDAILTAPF